MFGLWTNRYIEWSNNLGFEERGSFMFVQARLLWWTRMTMFSRLTASWYSGRMDVCDQCNIRKRGENKVVTCICCDTGRSDPSAPASRGVSELFASEQHHTIGKKYFEHWTSTAPRSHRLSLDTASLGIPLCLFIASLSHTFSWEIWSFLICRYDSLLAAFTYTISCWPFTIQIPGESVALFPWINQQDKTICEY